MSQYQCQECGCPVENRGNDCVVKHKGHWLCYPCVILDIEAERDRLANVVREYRKQIRELAVLIRSGTLS